MRKIELAPEPADFDKKVRQPGMDFLATHTDGTEPKAYWKECKADLYKAYNGYCAYTTFRITPRDSAVVDHFLPKASKEGRKQIYEWRNYRLSSFHINSVKKDGVGIIDPVDLPENAFRLDDSMRLHVNHDVFDKKDDAKKAEYTLERLGLNNQDYLDDRREIIAECLDLDGNQTGPESLGIPVKPAGEASAKSLRKQSLFMYEEAVRLGYCIPVNDKKEKSPARQSPR